ncbi:hypothetical protein FKW77_005836 [Venturia effusa]|uniref:Ankyrin repeat containing protein n=1 Tax=Venturia effusa TaxID=50376 RepID=A0A517LHB7_9PEZI|nr:hypothetical protein FKW77_005836 [Venturia effusa]
MRDEARLLELARLAGAKPVARLLPLSPPAVLPNFATEHDISEVRRKLTEKRQASGYRDPSKKITNILKSKREKQELKNPENWTFSNAERRDLLDATIHGGGTLGSSSGSSAGLAQAIVEFPDHTPLDVNIRQQSDESTEKKARNDSAAGHSAIYSDWLEIVAAQGNGAPFVALLCSRGTRQNALNKSLGIALTSLASTLKGNFGKTIEQLLMYGAETGEYMADFLEAVRLGNIDIVYLFLRAPKQLPIAVLSDALLSAVTSRSYQLVAILLAHGANPNYRSGASVISAVRQTDMHLTSLLLTASPAEFDPSHAGPAVLLVSKFPPRSKAQFLQLLLAAGVDVNIDAIQDELCSAVAQLQFELIEVLLSADMSSTSASKAVDFIPAEASEQDGLRLLRLLVAKGAKGGPWGATLLAAVGFGHMALCEALVENGASIDHDNAHAVRMALRNQDLALIGILMKGSSSPHVLAKALSQAMKMPGKTQRFDAVDTLLTKGVSGPELDIALRRAASETSLFRDPKMVDVLVKHGASVSNFGESNSNCVHIVSSRGDLELLSILYTSVQPPSSDITSQAVPLVFRSRTQTSRSSLLKMLHLLLKHGARGEPVAETLIDAVRTEDDGVVCELLVAGGADANYQNGLAIQEAFRKEAPETLEIICTKAKIEKETWAYVLPLALHPETYHSTKTMLVLSACRVYRNILDTALIHETGRSSIRHEVVSMLLEVGAFAGCDNAAAFTGAIRARSSTVFNLLLQAHNSEETNAKSFDSCMQLAPKERLPFARLLIEAQVSSAQLSRHLKQVIEEGDDDLLRLMLANGADTAAEDGASFIAAASLEDTTLFEQLVQTHPNVEVLMPALIRSIKSESRLTALLGSCLGRLESQLAPDDNRLLFLAMQYHPRGHELMRLLLIHGCPAGLPRLEQLGPSMVAEAVTPLLWALHQPRPGISEQVILTLLKLGHEANPEFMTVRSDSVALIKATESGRHAIIERLLEFDPPINVSVRNSKKQSALLLACRNNDSISATMLLKAKARPNDGSLHEAARQVQPELLSMLLAHGHDARLAYAGLTPLADFCRNAIPSGSLWESKAYRVIEKLFSAGTDPFEIYGPKRKTILHLALDNDYALEITSVLLEFPQISAQINDDGFLFEQDGVNYSPCKYVQTFYQGPPTGMRDTLKQMLADRNCRPRLFSNKGAQPEGAIGIPKHIEDMLNMQALLSLQATQDVKRMEEKAQAAQRIMNDDHRLALAHSNERHQTSLSQAQQLEAYEARASQRKHEEEKRMTSERHKLFLQNEAATAVQRRQIADTDRNREFAYTKKMALLETETLEKRTSIQRKLITEQESAAQRQQERNLLLLTRQDESVRTRAREMKAVAGLAGNQNQPLRLENGNEWGTVD